MTLRARASKLLHDPTGKSATSRRVNRFLIFLIITNTITAAIETLPDVEAKFGSLLYFFEAASMLLFFVEYLTRFWCCVEQAAFASPISGRLRWAARPLAILDLIVIVSFFAPFDLRFLRVFRLLRLFRVINLNGLANTYEGLKAALRQRRDLLLLAMILMTMAVFCSAGIVYAFEHEAQPKVFSSMPAAIWWAVVTLTTVAYGDMYPITFGGRVAATATMLFGIGIFALPTAILTSAVLQADSVAKKPEKSCPHCGKPLGE